MGIRRSQPSCDASLAAMIRGLTHADGAGSLALVSPPEAKAVSAVQSPPASP